MRQDPGYAWVMRRWERALEWSALSALAWALGALWTAARPRPFSDTPVVPEPPKLPPGRLVHVPGRGEMFVREAPGPNRDAPTVVLLHGWMFPADLHWFSVYEPLSASARVIAMDHRGHGRGLRPSQPFRLVDVADDVAALVRHLDIGPAVAVGYSMGGPVAQLLWQRHPDVVAGMVLCATSGTFNVTARDRWQWRAMGLLQVALRLLPRHWWDALVTAQVDGRLPFAVTHMLDTDLPQELRDLLPWMVGEADRGSAEDVAEAGRELSRYDARGWLGSIDVPTAVIVTVNDALVRAEQQRDMAARIPGAEVIELMLDHDAILNAEDEFIPALVKAVDLVIDQVWHAGQ